MTHVTHTPGPWSYHAWTANGGRRFGIETADHRHGIASIVPNETASTLLTMAQHEANARLISASPDLLAAIKVFVRDRATCPTANGADLDAWEMLKAAVRKAAGE